MLHAVVPPPDRATAGFTVIEALIALAVMTISVIAIGSLMGSTARGARQLEQHVALVQAAYNVVWLSLPSRSDVGSSDLSGELMGQPWRVNIAPFDAELGAPTGDVRWVPQRIRVRVQSASGAALTLETVRLFKRPSE